MADYVLTVNTGFRMGGLDLYEFLPAACNFVWTSCRNKPKKMGRS